MATCSYLRQCLADAEGCEENNIFKSNLYNINRGGYDLRLTDWLGTAEISHALPPAAESTETCGEITVQTTVLTGLKAGTPVAGGSPDVISTALHTGLKDEFTLNAVMGT